MSWYRGAVILALTGWLCLWLSVVTGEPRLAIQTRTAIASAPADIALTITLVRHPDNRLLVIETIGDEYRRSAYQLDGEQAPRLWQRWEKALPAGCYTFMASVYSATQLAGAAQTAQVRVIGLGGDPCV